LTEPASVLSKQVKPGKPRMAVILFLSAGLLPGCSHDGPSEPDRPCIAVTTSYIECAVADVAGAGFRIVRLLPPGGCPGHFDVTPGTIDHLRQTPLLFRFHFQEALDAKIERLGQTGLNVVPLRVSDGLSIPATYRTICEAVCEALCREWPTDAAPFRRRLSETQARLTRLTDECRDSVRQSQYLRTKVLASGRQAAFCEWLGLEVAARISDGEASRLSELSRNLANGRKEQIRLVIANQQEGDQLARSLARQLRVPWVVFSNFPSMEPGQQTFDDLVRANVTALLQGARP
jgi:zinc transport system substrate-binding protein